MHDDATVVALVLAARDGDREAWNQIVERYAPLVWGICRRHGLSRIDTDDVGQAVWLSLFEHLATIREPAALPGWLARTTGRECLRVLRVAEQRQRAERLAEQRSPLDDGFELVEDELEQAELYDALRQAFTQLQPRCQALLALLFQEVPARYLQIGAELGMKIGSIGPTRERCLAELRRCPALSALLEAQQQQAKGVR
jgi:RNA polymerase sigma factor (sigma-70 family)